MSAFELPERPTAERDLYEQDFYSWAMRQAALLREGRLETIDRDHIIEELEILGREQFNGLVGALRVLMLHMLKWDHQPEKRSRSWLTTITVQRDAFLDSLADNPGLKPRFDEAVEKAYARARRHAAAETGLRIDTFPNRCPYEFAALKSREFALPESR